MFSRSKTVWNERFANIRTRTEEVNKWERGREIGEKQSTDEVTTVQPSKSTEERLQFASNERRTQPMSNTKRIHWKRKNNNNKRSKEWKGENETKKMPHLGCIFSHWNRWWWWCCYFSVVVRAVACCLYALKWISRAKLAWHDIESKKKIRWNIVDHVTTRITNVSALYKQFLPVLCAKIDFSKISYDLIGFFEFVFVNVTLSFQPNAVFEN